MIAPRHRDVTPGCVPAVQTLGQDVSKYVEIVCCCGVSCCPVEAGATGCAIAFDAEQHSTSTHADQVIAAQPCLPAGS